MRYRYAALVRDPAAGTWARTSGELVTTQDPIEALRTANRKPIFARPVRFRLPRLPWQGISPGTLRVWYTQMSMLTHQDPIKAVAICADRSDGNMKKLLNALVGELVNSSLEEAMSMHPEIPDHHVAQVSVLRNQTKEVKKETWATLAEMVTSEEQLKKKRNRVIFNLTLTILGGFAVLQLIGSTVSPGVESFAAVIANKPIHEDYWTGFARWIVCLVAGPFGLAVAGGVVALIALLMVVVRVSSQAGERYERLLWSLPYFGNIVRMIETARIARAFGPTYLAQPAWVAVRRIRGVTSRAIVLRELDRISERLRGRDPHGKTDLPGAFASPLLDPLFSQFLVGVGSGAQVVAGACRSVASALESDAFSRLEQWLDEVEPWVLSVAMGAFYVLLSFDLLPLFDAFQAAAHAHAQTYYIPQ